MRKLVDNFGRVHDYLRVSVTDKCNLYCFYCNPSDAIQYKLNKKEILNYSELYMLIKLFVTEFGFKKIRITGGEPFARKGIMDFLADLSELKKVHPFILGISSNGILIKDKISLLKKFGVNNLNISLDSLDSKKFKEITKADNFDSVMWSIKDAAKSNFDSIKLNSVIMRGINDNELYNFVSLAADINVNVRFIEYMPFTDNSWSKDAFISYSEMKEIIEKKYKLKDISESGGLAKDYLVEGTNAKISFISSVSDHFCGTCNRLRITSEGKMKLCLFSLNDGTLDLKSIIRNNSNESEIIKAIEDKLSAKKFSHPETEELSLYKGNFMIGIGG